MKNRLSKTGLNRLWYHILLKLSGKVDKEEGKGLSTNDFTDADKEKLNNFQPNGITLVSDNEPTSEIYTLWVDTNEEQTLAMPADAIKYKTFSIATSAWSGSGPYTYQMTASGITANTAILNLTLDAASQTYQKAQLDWETGANFIKLSTATKPTGTISGYLIAAEVTVI